MSPVLLAVIIGVIVVMAITMRPKKDDADATGEVAEREGPARSVLDDDEDDAEHEPLPVTAEGLAFFPTSKSEVRLVNLMREDQPGDMLPDWLRQSLESGAVPYQVLNKLYYQGAGGGVTTASGLHAGDYTGARIKPGVAGSYAYRLETLGRDGDFGFFPFTTRRGAESALHLLESHGIVSRPRDEDGDPVAASEEDFEEARRRYEESERMLAMDMDDDAEGGAPYSDRR